MLTLQEEKMEGEIGDLEEETGGEAATGEQMKVDKLL
jgi:hypothetical protein